jgi:hypothetical protein
MNQIRKPSWNFVRAEITNLARCMLISATPISSGLRSSPTVESQSLKIIIPLSVYGFHWDSSSLPYRFVMPPRLSRFLTCHNDVIDAGQNNRLFSPCTDMDRERLRLSHAKRNVLRTNMWSIFLSTYDIVSKDKDSIKRDTLI